MKVKSPVVSGRSSPPALVWTGLQSGVARTVNLTVVYQGSANWSGMSTLSDEQGFIIRSKTLEKKYSKAGRSARIDDELERLKAELQKEQ